MSHIADIIVYRMTDTTDKTELYLRLRGKLRAYAGSMLQSGDDVEDALQDMFVRLWKMPAEEQGRLTSTMFVSLRNLCIDRIRRRRHESDIEEMEAAGHVDPYNGDASEMVANIRKLVDESLPEMQRKVFSLYIYEQLEMDEIADRLSINYSAVRTNLCRARKSIRKLLNLRFGYEYEG